MKIHEYNQMMSYLTRPATPKAVPVARELMAKGTKPIEKKIEKKEVVKVVEKPKPNKPKPIPFPSNAQEFQDMSDWLELLDPGGWASDEDKRAGLLEFELADEFWRDLYEEYKKKGGTLNFKDFMEEQTKTSSKNGIKNILRI